MTADEIVNQLKPLGTTPYKSILQKHGIPEPLLGVKIEELKKFQKRIKKDYQLALELYDTGIYDARYLAGLIADDSRMTKKDLQRWVQNVNCPRARRIYGPMGRFGEQVRSRTGTGMDRITD